jgi:transposase
LSTKARGRVVRAIAAQSHAGPFGGRVAFSRDTLERWIRRYRRGGFEALAPSARQPGTRIDAPVLDMAVALKKENPGRTAAQVARILKASTGWSPSETTLLRLFHRHELMGPPAGDASGHAVFGRFEAATPNERWVGDALHGPRVGGRKTYLFAFLDDRSRLLVGYRFGFAEDTVRLAAALQPALAARGVPQSVYVVVLGIPSHPTKRAAACGNDTPRRSLMFEVERRIVRWHLQIAGGKKVCGERWRASPGPDGPPDGLGRAA